MAEKVNTVLEFGRELVNARNYKGLTLEQISEITKIAARYLQAMEEGEWDLLPRPYMEAFLKSYAETVGMNVPKVIKKYREMVLTELVALGEAEPTEQVDEKTSVQEAPLLYKSIFNSKFKIYGLISGLVIVLLIVFIVKSCGDGKEVGERENQADLESGATQTLAETVRDQEARLPEVQDTTQVNQERREDTPPSPRRVTTEIDLQAKASARCWLKATIDQGQVRDVLLVPGDTITLQAADEIHIVVGNAGGLELILGGESLGSLGPPEKPVTLVIGHDGIKSQRLGAWQPDYESEISPEDLEN